MRGADAPTRLAMGIGILAAAFALSPGRARADGALPNSQSILTPTERPQEILLVTNFGVVMTEDGGGTWTWSCEQTANSLGYLYQLSLSPRHRVFALANQRLVYSDDNTCGWQVAAGALMGQDVADAFVDRGVIDRVLAIGAVPLAAGGMTYSLLQSSDAGTTFASPLFTAAVGDSITGVETSVSDPNTIYMTMAVGPTYRPTLARSSDRGATWQPQDLSGSLGKGGVALFAVDPLDARRVFLLWNDPNLGAAVAVTTDGGATATITLPPDGSTLTAFLRTPSGTILVSGNLFGTPSLHRSRDGGMTFESVPSPPHVTGLSARGGTVYAGADEFMGDGFALAISHDEGTTWQPFMTYDQVRAISPCVKTTCQEICGMQVQMALWSGAVCSADVPASVSPDAGTGVSGGAGGGSGSGGAGGGTQKTAAGAGSGCGVAPGRAGDAGQHLPLLLGAVAISLLLGRASCRQTPRRRPRPPGRTWFGTRRANEHGARDRE